MEGSSFTGLCGEHAGDLDIHQCVGGKCAGIEPALFFVDLRAPLSCGDLQSLQLCPNGERWVRSFRCRCASVTCRNVSSAGALWTLKKQPAANNLRDPIRRVVARFRLDPRPAFAPPGEAEQDRRVDDNGSGRRT